MSKLVVKSAASIIDQTVFLRVQFGVMGNSRKVSNSVLNTDCDATLLKVQKSLIDSPELDAIRKADGQLRTYLYNLCLPYDMGILLLPIALLDKVNGKLKMYSEERAELVKAFIAAYPALCEVAVTRLGSLYNAGDYPSLAEVAAKFTFNYQYWSFVVPEALKNAGLYAEAMAKAQEQVKVAAEEITLLMRQTLLELVNHLSTALEPTAEGKPKRLFSSAVTNVQDFLDTFTARNITNDSELEEIVLKARTLIHPGVSADVIKADGQFKAAIQTGIASIAEQLSGLTETVHSRKFREE
jgi:hypothetical protein